MQTGISVVNSFLSLICLLAGTVNFLNGYLLLHDDRALNRMLTSFLLMFTGINIAAEGFVLLGFKNFQYLQLGVLVFQVAVGAISTILIRDYQLMRSQKIIEREIKKEEGKKCLRNKKEEKS